MFTMGTANLRKPLTFMLNGLIVITISDTKTLTTITHKNSGYGLEKIDTIQLSMD